MSVCRLCRSPAVVALYLRCDGAHPDETQVCGQHYLSVICNVQTEELTCGHCRPARRPMRLIGERRLT